MGSVLETSKEEPLFVQQWLLQLIESITDKL